MKSQVSAQEVNRKLKDTPIAIVGLSALFPQAANLREYWSNIFEKKDCITDIPETH